MRKEQKEQLKTLVFTALGSASMCWSETPKGIFESDKCELIGDKLIDDILELI